MNDRRGITELPSSDLQTLHKKVSSSRLTTPITPAGLQAAGLGHLKDHIKIFEGLNEKAVTALIETLLNEREHQKKTKIDLVWTGPEATCSTARDTWVVMRELFHQAKEHVLIAGFRFDDGKELFEPLHKSMVENKAQVQIFLDIPRAKKNLSIEDFTRNYVQEFAIKNWPFGAPFPDFYYDPRTVQVSSVASLHAKCVVVDQCSTLIGSANFTNRGQTRNIEIGVLIEDERFAREVISQWQGLIGAGLVVGVSG